MKKVLAVLFILLFTAGDASATIEVRYNNAGARRSVQYGARTPRSAANFGSNAIFAPGNRRYAGTRQRQMQNNRGGTSQAMAAPASDTTLSRFDKSYTISTAKKSYTRGGVTYYN